MDDREDIFGKDIKDSSHLQLVSSDEEDLGSQRSHESPKAKADFKASSPTKRDNYCEEKFDRQLRLDKSVESNIGADTQNIIDEINKIFEKSETHEEPEPTKSPSLLEKGKQMITDITRKLASVPENLLTPKTGRPEPPAETKRTRSTRKRSYRFDSDLEDLSGFSSPSDPSVLTDDDDYEPSKGHESKRKTAKKKGRKVGRKPKRQKAEKNEPMSEEEPVFGDSKSFDNFGFDRATSLPAPAAADFLNLKDDSGDMICLKFAVVDQNRNVINDSRLDSVFIKTTETLGNIAKKIGELYHLGAEYHPRIRVIIDGETQDHDLQIGRRRPSPGSPELGVEERMQIDIKFPPKDEVILKNGYHPKSKGRNRNMRAHEPPEVVEID